MRETLLFLFFSFSLFSFSQDTASVLFIGNSYTAYNNLPQMVADLATSLGDHVNKDSNTPGGATFEAHSYNTTNYTKIHSENWDYVVLQAQSQEPSFPDNQVNTNTLPYAEELADSVYANNFCTDVMFYMTWGRENGDPQWQPISTYDGMQQRLRDAYMRFADSVQGSVSPVGMAWKHVRDNYPAIQLYAGDGSHPSLEGSYLAACTFYASIFRKPTSGATYLNGVDPVVASQLQAAADLVVLDSLDHWHLRAPSEHTQANFTYNSLGNGTVNFYNESWKGQSFFWDFGDGNTSTDEHPTHTYLSDGIYSVSLTTTSECNIDDTLIDVGVAIATISEIEGLNVKIQNLGGDIYYIDSDEQLGDVSIHDALGNLVAISSDNLVDLSRLSSGMYLVRISTAAKEVTVKLSK